MITIIDTYPQRGPRIMDTAKLFSCGRGTRARREARHRGSETLPDSAFADPQFCASTRPRSKGRNFLPSNNCLWPKASLLDISVRGAQYLPRNSAYSYYFFTNRRSFSLFHSSTFTRLFFG